MFQDFLKGETFMTRGVTKEYENCITHTHPTPFEGKGRGGGFSGENYIIALEGG
jgi:hypothetical protein